MSNEFIKRIISSLILLPLLLIITYLGSYYFIGMIFIYFFIVLIEWYNLEKRNIYFLAGVLFSIFSFYTVYQFRNSFANDYAYFFLLINICVSTDIGGYIFGKIIKGPKLTKISPNKTIAGLIGSFIFAIFSTIILFHTNFIYFNPKILTFDNLIFIILISAISQLGDILISSFKRNSKIKNTGNLIPGHGGLLDRIDGMIFVFPFSYFVIFLNNYQYF